MILGANSEAYLQEWENKYESSSLSDLSSIEMINRMIETMQKCLKEEGQSPLDPRNLEICILSKEQPLARLSSNIVDKIVNRQFQEEDLSQDVCHLL